MERKENIWRNERELRETWKENETDVTRKDDGARYKKRRHGY